MSRRSNRSTAEKVAIAQWAAAKLTGVQPVQEARPQVETVEQFLARGGVVQVLAAPGDCFLDTNRVPYAD